VGNTKQVAETLAAFGWPPLMRMDIACRYTCRSRWTLQRAVQSGELIAAGRQKRSLTFRREDLDRWMLGPAVEPQAAAEPPRSTSTSGGALERLRSLTRGVR
jgi:hypothetical protein